MQKFNGFVLSKQVLEVGESEGAVEAVSVSPDLPPVREAFSLQLLDRFLVEVRVLVLLRKRGDASLRHHVQSLWDGLCLEVLDEKRFPRKLLFQLFVRLLFFADLVHVVLVFAVLRTAFSVVERVQEPLGFDGVPQALRVVVEDATGERSALRKFRAYVPP